MSGGNSGQDERFALTDFALDGADGSLTGAVSNRVAALRSGDLGSLPAVLAIGVLVAIFGAVSPSSFLTLLNFANFLEQASGVIVIAMAVSFTLLLGEIDLAAGFTAGVSAAVLATRLQEWPLVPSVIVSALVAILLGTFTGYMVAKVGIPSFVVTLANVLLFQGILLLLVRDGGSVRISDPYVNGLVGGTLSPVVSWLAAGLGLVVYGWVVVRKQQSSHGAVPISVAALKLAGTAMVVVVVTALLNQNRAFARAPEPISGLPTVVPVIVVILFLLTILLTRTRYGRHLYAVGGNAEAARRAGINVAMLKLSAFAMCGLLAGIGGAFLASRVNSVDPNTGANDTLLLAVGAAVIGGTSLFGGQGRMVNAVLGGFVLALIPNGLTLVGKQVLPLLGEVDFGSSGIKFICAGLALLVASSVDALSRNQGSIA